MCPTASLVYLKSTSTNDRAPFRITSAEAKHITVERRAELVSEYSDAERETRLEGTPQLGTGPVFPIELLPGMIRPFDPDALPSWTRHVVGIDFGFDHPFACAYIAWDHQTGAIWVIDSFRMERSLALYHVQRIHSMTRGLRIPIAWPHDGAVHDKGSGLPLAQQYRGFGANMMPKHATNHGTQAFALEPALEEMREMMFAGRITIGGHNQELIEELRTYHRDEDYRIVKQRDDLVSALRYAVMMRRQGRTRSECDGVGFGNMPFAAQRRDRSGPQIAHGMDFNLFATGGDY
jgi:hypothetical protein